MSSLQATKFMVICYAAIASEHTWLGCVPRVSLCTSLILLCGSRLCCQARGSESQPRGPLESQVTLQMGDSPWPGRMARCSSGSQSPRAVFGGDRHGPAHSGHMC